MQEVLIHFVQMEKYPVPEFIAQQGNEAIEQYIVENGVMPTKVDSRDWEVVDIANDNLAQHQIVYFDEEYSVIKRDIFSNALDYIVVNSYGLDAWFSQVIPYVEHLCELIGSKITYVDKHQIHVVRKNNEK